MEWDRLSIRYSVLRVPQQLGDWKLFKLSDGVGQTLYEIQCTQSPIAAWCLEMVETHVDRRVQQTLYQMLSPTAA